MKTLINAKDNESDEETDAFYMLDQNLLHKS